MNLLAAIAFAALFLSIGSYLDRDEPAHQAAEAARTEKRKEMSATTLCWRANGGVPAWTADGALVCKANGTSTFIARTK